MYFIGIDIGSTAAKTVVLNNNDMLCSFIMPTGWSSKETAGQIGEKLLGQGIDIASEDTRVIATGYGRVSVDYAHKIITEITCHGKGGYAMTGENCTIIDVGGQDTKVITVENGQVSDFLMNDKCSAGTGKFLEIMANRLGLDIGELFTLAEKGTPMAISSMCTVFAESEVISHIGAGALRTDIAAGVVDSVITKVALLANRHGIKGKPVLTGGLSSGNYFVTQLAQKLGQEVLNPPLGQYAGAYGAALIAREKFAE